MAKEMKIQAYAVNVKTGTDRKIGRPFIMRNFYDYELEEKEEQLNDSFRDRGWLREGEVINLEEA